MRKSNTNKYTYYVITKISWLYLIWYIYIDIITPVAVIYGVISIYIYIYVWVKTYITRYDYIYLLLTFVASLTSIFIQRFNTFALMYHTLNLITNLIVDVVLIFEICCYVIVSLNIYHSFVSYDQTILTDLFQFLRQHHQLFHFVLLIHYF